MRTQKITSTRSGKSLMQRISPLAQCVKRLASAALSVPNTLMARVQVARTGLVKGLAVGRQFLAALAKKISRKKDNTEATPKVYNLFEALALSTIIGIGVMAVIATSLTLVRAHRAPVEQVVAQEVIDEDDTYIIEDSVITDEEPLLAASYPPKQQVTTLRDAGALQKMNSKKALTPAEMPAIKKTIPEKPAVEKRAAAKTATVKPSNKSLAMTTTKKPMATKASEHAASTAVVKTPPLIANKPAKQKTVTTPISDAPKKAITSGTTKPITQKPGSGTIAGKPK